MAGFPETGTYTGIGYCAQAAGPGSLIPFVLHTKGPGPHQEERHRTCLPDALGDLRKKMTSDV